MRNNRLGADPELSRRCCWGGSNNVQGPTKTPVGI